MLVIVKVIPSIFGDQWVQLWQREKDPKVLTEPFYNLPPVWLDRIYLLVYLWVYVFEEMPLMFPLSEWYFLYHPWLNFGLFDK